MAAGVNRVVREDEENRGESGLHGLLFLVEEVESVVVCPRRGNTVIAPVDWGLCRIKL